MHVMTMLNHNSVHILQHKAAEHTVTGLLFDQDNFIFTGFNSQIPKIGQAELWYDCHACGNATAYLPTKCRKCNSMSFEKREPKGRARSFRYKRLRGVA